MRNALLACLLVTACGGEQTTTTTKTTPTVTPTTVATPESSPEVKDDPVADAWKTGGGDEYLKAADCPSFRKVPARIEQNTIIETPCLEIPAGTTVTIAQDKNLVIVATREFRIGDGVKIVGRGQSGAAGADAQVKSKDWAPDEPDQSGKIFCACRGARCKPGWQPCSAGNDPELRGGRGGSGRRGASVHVVTRELIVGSGVSFDVSGGLGGSAGASGHVECRYGGTQCASAPATSDGDGEGGATGTITLRASLPSGLPSMIAIERVATPPSAVNKRLVDTMGPFRDEVAEAKKRGAGYATSRGE